MGLSNWQITTTVENIGQIARNTRKLSESISEIAKSQENLNKLLEELILLLKTE